MELDESKSTANNFVVQDDDLIDDLMNIVQNDDLSNDARTSGELGGLDSATSRDVRDEERAQRRTRNAQTCEMDDEFEDEDDESDYEIDQMLEKPIDMLDTNKNDQVNFYTYDKIQIKNIYWRGCQDSILPEGWVQVTHACGMPLYLNRQTRVCTLSRPYYIAQSSARKHDIPVSAIPCLAYQKRKEKVENEIREHNTARMASRCPRSDFASNSSHQAANPPDGANATTGNEVKFNNKKFVVSIATNEEKQKENHMTPEQIHDYCKRLFEFDIIKVKKFKTWSDRKKFLKKSKQRKFLENAKLLKIQTKTQKGINKELNINMTNKTPLSILYEYSNQVFKVNPRFEIQEKENPKDPFQAVCYINDKICGKGNGNSKKAAKNSSAEAALCVLIPEFKGQIDNTNSTKKSNDEMYSFFDSYNVEHTHVYTLSQKLGAPLPYDILLTCLKYNFAINMARNRKQFIEEEIKPIKYRNCLYKMKLAQYEVEVNCTKKKEGRQLAAQKILKLMHPHIQTWGSILRLYGSRMDETTARNENEPTSGANGSENNEGSLKNVDDAKLNVSNANGTQNSQKIKPNNELLEKLKEEMRKLRQRTSAAAAAASAAAAVVEAVNDNKPDAKQDDHPIVGPNPAETLLTIPPLILPNCNEMKLISNRQTTDNTVTKIEDNDDGMIVFTSSATKQDANEIELNPKRKRHTSSDSENENEFEDDDESDTSSEGSSSSSSSASSSSSSSTSSDDDDDEEDENDSDDLDTTGDFDSHSAKNKNTSFHSNSLSD